MTTLEHLEATNGALQAKRPFTLIFRYDDGSIVYWKPINW